MANKQLLLGFALLPMWAMAQQTAQPTIAQPSYLDEMAKIDAQIAFIQKQNDLKMVLRQSAGGDWLPKVQSILIDEKGGQAQVVYSSGIVRWVKRGDSVQDGMSVINIAKTGVVVGGQGGKVTLAFVTPVNSTNPSQAAGGPMPPLPGVNIPMPMPPAAVPPVAQTAPGAPAPAPAAPVAAPGR